MHLGNGAITPECAALTLSAATAGLGWAALQLRRAPIQSGRLVAAGGLGAAVFAAQMINVPVLPGVSAHLVGGVLLAWALGPSLGALTMAAVLVVQAICLGDGGFLALGANIINMGLVPAVMVAAVRRWLPVDAGFRLRLATAAIVPMLALVAGALLLVGEVTLLRSPGELAGAAAFAGAMIATHALFGIAEGGLTAALLIALDRRLLPKPAQLSFRQSGVALIAAILMVALLLPLASGLPDGYEAAAAANGMGQLLSQETSTLAALGDANLAAYSIQQRWVANFEAALPNPQWLALAGMLTAGIIACTLAWLTTARRMAPARQSVKD